MGLFISEAVAQAAETAPASQGNPMFQFVLIGGLFLFMYFMIIRPQKKKQKEHEALVGGLAKGDEVVLSSGLLGKIVSVDESYVVLNVGNEITQTYQKIAVHAD